MLILPCCSVLSDGVCLSELKGELTYLLSPWSDFQNVAWILGPSTTTFWTFPSDLVL